MNFTRDFFTRNIPGLELHLAKFKGQRCAALELGSFEGRSAVWFMDNILTHEASYLICVDIEVSKTLEDNLKRFMGKAETEQMDATEFARIGALSYNPFDLIYVDAHHIARDVILQAGLLWTRLKPGGIMIFDDYGHPEWTVKPAVDFFIQHWEGVKVLHRGWQAFLEKTQP